MRIKYFNYLVSWVQNEVEKAGATGVILGISGGVDSALVAAIAKKAFPKNSLGVVMPIGNMGEDLIDAYKLIKLLEIEHCEIDLSNTFTTITKVINVNSKISIANIKPRLRMTTLYAIAQEKNYLVLGTDNAAEWILGYFTKHGDGGVDLLPIINLTKEEVRETVKKLNLPNVFLEKQPSAGLWQGQTDEEELGFKYADVDKYIKNKTLNEKVRVKIESQIKRTLHKRIPAPTPLKPADVF